MLSKTVNSISRSTTEMINVSVDMVRGLTWSEVRDLIRFARRRLREEKLPQVAGSLTFTTTLALVPLLTIVLAIFTNFPIFNNFRTALDTYFVQTVMPKGIANTIIRCGSGRGRLTRHIWLKARSIMPIIAADVNSSATAPTADSRVALLANMVRLLMMVFEIPFGITVCTK